MTTIQLRIEEEIKNSVKDILDKIGLDMSAAIKMYLYQIIVEKGLPFRPRLTENGLTPEQEAEIIQASEEAKRGINVDGPFETWKEAKEYLHSLIENKSNKDGDKTA